MFACASEDGRLSICLVNEKQQQTSDDGHQLQQHEHDHEGLMKHQQQFEQQQVLHMLEGHEKAVTGKIKTIFL